MHRTTSHAAAFGLALALAGAAEVRAESPAAAPPARSAPAAPAGGVEVDAEGSAEARAALDRVMTAKSAAERTAAVAALVALAPTPVAELGRFLARPRRSSDAERRAVLTSIGGDLPDEKGKFATPKRQAADDEAKNDAFDWLAKLVEVDAGTPGLADVIGDVAAIRALAGGHDPDGAGAILDFAFTADGLPYRDECGRFLRRMAPWSLPALIRGAERAGDLSRARYATYQLERLDRQNPRKALADAPSEELKVEVLEAFEESLDREAVFVVLDTVDDVSPAVRRAARKAWMEYATGRTPRPAPKEKLQLPGGKLAEKETPLWLTSRELADIALRRRLEQLTGKPTDPRAKLGALSKQLFDHYDAERTTRLGGELARALELLAAGKASEAAAICDRILVQVPDFARRAEAAPIYLAAGEAREKAGEWHAAAVAFGKAAAMAGETELGAQALARHHAARGKAAEAKGESGAAEFARAREIDADAAAASAALPGGPRPWMLWAALGTVLAGLAMVVVGWAARRG